MLIHVVPEVLEKGDFLRQTIWVDLQSVEMFSRVPLDVLNIPASETINIHYMCSKIYHSSETYFKTKLTKRTKISRTDIAQNN